MQWRSSTVLRDGWSTTRDLWGVIIFFSCFINILSLAIPIYTAQIYDRVMQSGSAATLVVLTIMAAGAIAVGAFLEDVRTRLFVVAGIRLDSALSGRLVARLVDDPAHAGAHAREQTLRELDQARGIATGSGVLTLLDLPWTPIFIAVCFAMHPALGMLTFCGALALLGLALLNHRLVNDALERSHEAGEASYALTDSLLRHGETVRAMGMLPDLLRPWAGVRGDLISQQAAASRRNGQIIALIKLLRYALQLAVFGLGAWLVIERSLSAGALFAASLVTMRALTPIDQMVANWRSLAMAWRSVARLDKALAGGERPPTLSLPPPNGALSVEGVSYAPPGRDTAVLRSISFAVAPGETLGLVGPSASGKSTLARLLVGALKPSAGVVRLDAADVYDWERREFGRYVGYVGQTNEFFAGTIKDNICRFRETDPLAIVRAAQIAGVHEMILRLPMGYETRIDALGAPLSGGQRQRLALARAAFGEPRFIVLDEPNANLDADGDAALQALIERLKRDRVTIILIAHRPSALLTTDKVAVLSDGALIDFGPTAHVLPKIAPGFVTQMVSPLRGATP